MPKLCPPHDWPKDRPNRQQTLSGVAEAILGSDRPAEPVPNCAYAILYSAVWAAVLRAGLDPGIGLLHAPWVAARATGTMCQAPGAASEHGRPVDRLAAGEGNRVWLTEPELRVNHR